MTSKTIRRRKLRNAFNKYKKQIKDDKRLEHIKNKSDWLNQVRTSATLANVWDAWKHYIKVWKTARNFLKRSINDVDKSIKNDAFGTWKKLIYQARKQVFVMNIEELENRQVQHEE